MLFCQCLSLNKRDTPFPFEILLCAYQDFADILWSIWLDLCHPPLNICERVGVRNGVCKDDTSCPSVVSLCDIFKSLLTCSIPYLHFDFFVCNHEWLDLEIYSDSGHISIFEVILAEPSNKIGLSNSTVSNHDNFN